jgi:hypothetical protein
MPRSPEYQAKLDRGYKVGMKLYDLVTTRHPKKTVSPKAYVTPAEKFPEASWKNVPKGSRIVSISMPPLKK